MIVIYHQSYKLIKYKLKGRFIMKQRFSVVKEQQKMDDLQDKRDGVLKEAADTITSTMMTLNKSGEMNMKQITDIINSLCAGWSDSDKVAILRSAIAKLVVNL